MIPSFLDGANHLHSSPTLCATDFHEHSSISPRNSLAVATGDETDAVASANSDLYATAETAFPNTSPNSPMEKSNQGAHRKDANDRA